MSNTLRRKNAYIDHYQRSWLLDTEWRKSKYGGEYQVRVEYKGKARKKAMAEYHSDHFPRCFVGNTPRSYRNIEHRKIRTACKTEIANFYKNEEYEVLARATPKWDYWD
jgi:hypothetical protein